jgi:hypothetical protein
LSSPDPSEQIRFLTNIQRLLSEGLFTATYKYALIAALADLSVELGDDSGDPLPLATFAIAEKFVEYYWRHSMPYATANEARVLRQNTGRPATILSLIAEARRVHTASLPGLMRDGRAWPRLVRRIKAVVEGQPLWKLQTMGSEKLNFLYGPSDGKGSIELRPGVAFCFRQFYSLIQDAVRSAWLRDVRSLNNDLLGETVDLREFLFGAERNALEKSIASAELEKHSWNANRFNPAFTNCLPLVGPSGDRRSPNAPITIFGDFRERVVAKCLRIIVNGTCSSLWNDIRILLVLRNPRYSCRPRPCSLACRATDWNPLRRHQSIKASIMSRAKPRRLPRLDVDVEDPRPL